MSTHPARQQDQHYLVTGAGTGIGRAIAQRLAAEGARLSLMARTEARLHDTAQALRAAGAAQVGVFAADIRQRSQVDAAVTRAARELGPLRGVVANAGIGGANSPGPGDRFDDLVATNLVGTYSTLRAAQRYLCQGPEARHMVVISSILGRIGVPGYTGYCASKTALLGLTRALAHEVAGDNVQVNAICPGWVDTDMATQGLQGMAQAMGIDLAQARAQAMSAVPMGRMSRPEDIAGMVAWLCSSDARGVTGQSLDMNGGAWL